MVKEKLRRMLAIICLLSVLGTVMAGCTQEKAPEAEILIEQRADPYITRAEDGFYYFTASYPMQGEMDPEGYDRIILRRSKTLEGLKTAEEITEILQQPSGEKNCGVGPDLQARNRRPSGRAIPAKYPIFAGKRR